MLQLAKHFPCAPIEIGADKEGKEANVIKTHFTQGKVGKVPITGKWQGRLARSGNLGPGLSPLSNLHVLLGSRVEWGQVEFCA